jgi:hypothetical protein
VKGLNTTGLGSCGYFYSDVLPWSNFPWRKSIWNCHLRFFLNTELPAVPRKCIFLLCVKANSEQRPSDFVLAVLIIGRRRGVSSAVKCPSTCFSLPLNSFLALRQKLSIPRRYRGWSMTELAINATDLLIASRYFVPSTFWCWTKKITWSYNPWSGQKLRQPHLATRGRGMCETFCRVRANAHHKGVNLGRGWSDH